MDFEIISVIKLTRVEYNRLPFNKELIIHFAMVIHTQSPFPMFSNTWSLRLFELSLPASLLETSETESAYIN